MVLQKLYFLGHFGPKYLRKLYAADFELKVANLGILVIIKVLFFCFFSLKDRVTVPCTEEMEKAQSWKITLKTMNNGEMA